jgi:rhomboid protease GluP
MIGYAFIPSLKKHNDSRLQLSIIVILSVVLLIFSSVVYKSLSSDIGKYDRQMETFASIELNAMEVYALPEETPNDKRLSELKKGIDYWNEGLKLVEGFKDLDLPQLIKERNTKLKEYCELRIKSFELMYKAISEDTDNYETEINDYNHKINTIVTALTGEQ